MVPSTAVLRVHLSLKHFCHGMADLKTLTHSLDD
uniref:Uncharacterized protein n=1 Tax=Rhizophora mucronata TaxID=61149 RepID=A0A2P2PZS8_RHIMU